MRQPRRSPVLSSLALMLMLGQLFVPSASAQQAQMDVLIGFDRAPGQAEHALVGDSGGAVKRSFHLVPAVVARLPEPGLARLLGSPRVTRIESDRIIRALEGDLANSWGVSRIGARVVHRSGNRGAGVRVAVVDSGIDYFHPDLVDAYAGGWDFVNDDDDPFDDFGHGTHVAGIIAAGANGFGVVGVAPEVEIYALKVLDQRGLGRTSDIIAALEWAVDNGIEVANHSYMSSIEPGSLLRQAFDNSYAAGILHVAAAGNGGTCPPTVPAVAYPARFASAIAVAATDPMDKRVCFSSTGPEVELAAPGLNIVSTLPLGTYGTGSGTSLAAPHVTGAAALVIAAGVQGPQNVRALLNQTALDLGTAGRDPRYGHGLVDVEAAVTAAMLPPDRPPTVHLTHPASGAILSGTVILRADAHDDRRIHQVAFRIDGAPVATDSDGSDGWAVPWDTTTTTNGPHTVTAEAADSAGQTAQDSLPVEVSNVVPSVYVGGLRGSARPAGGRTWRASATVTARTADLRPAAGATVVGVWDVSAGRRATCVTGPRGRCTVTSQRIRAMTATFTVIDILLAGYDFRSSDAHDPEGNSDGRSITLTKPWRIDAQADRRAAVGAGPAVMRLR